MVKKLLVTILLATMALILLAPAVYAIGETSAGRYEYQTSGNDSADIHDKNIMAQTFTAAFNHDVSYIRLYCYVEGTPSYIVMQLRTVDAGTGEPTHDLVYDSRDPLTWTRNTSDCTLSDVNPTLSGNGSWIDFPLDHPVALSNGTQYAIVVRAPAGAPSWEFHWLYNNGGDPLVGGNGTAYTSSDDGENWTASGAGTDDFMFEVLGQSCIFFETNNGVNIFSSFREADDWLICAAIRNTSNPYYPQKDIIQKYFRLQLIDDSTGLSVAESVLRAWDCAPASIYINAEQAATMQWGGDYTLRVQANYGDNFYIDYNLSAANWVGDVLDELDSWCKAIASWAGLRNENDKDYYLASAGASNVLNDDGISMFSLGIPGLAEERGQYIFQSYVISDDANLNPDETPNPALQNKYDWNISLGTTLVDALTDFGDPFNLEGNIVALAAILALYVAVVGGSFPLGHGTAGSIAGLFILLIGMIAGVVNVVWILLAAVVALIFMLRQILILGQ